MFAKTNQSIKCVTLSMVPIQYRTESFAKYDTNGNGVIESFNANGENELKAMSDAIGIDLSEYAFNASAIKNVGIHKTWEGNQLRNNMFQTIVYDEHGNVLKDIRINDSIIHQFSYRENGEIVNGSTGIARNIISNAHNGCGSIIDTKNVSDKVLSSKSPSRIMHKDGTKEVGYKYNEDEGVELRKIYDKNNKCIGLKSCFEIEGLAFSQKEEDSAKSLGLFKNNINRKIGAYLLDYLPFTGKEGCVDALKSLKKGEYLDDNLNVYCWNDTKNQFDFVRSEKKA